MTTIHTLVVGDDGRAVFAPPSDRWVCMTCRGVNVHHSSCTSFGPNRLALRAADTAGLEEAKRFYDREWVPDQSDPMWQVVKRVDAFLASLAPPEKPVTVEDVWDAIRSCPHVAREAGSRRCKCALCQLRARYDAQWERGE